MRCGPPTKISVPRCWPVAMDPDSPYSCLMECASGWKSVPLIPRSLLPQNPSRRPPTHNCCRHACDLKSSRFWPACFWKSNGR